MEKDAQKRFDGWSSKYERSWTWRFFFDPLHNRLAREAGDLAGCSVLDVGCGTGGLLRRLVRKGASTAVGVDFSEGMLQAARRHTRGEAGISFIAATAEALPLPDEGFDLVVSSVAFHHFPQPEAALCEMFRVARPGGRLLLCDMCGEGLAGRVFLFYGSHHATDTHYFDRATLSAMASAAGFNVDSAKIVRRFPPAMLVEGRRPPPGPDRPQA